MEQLNVEHDYTSAIGNLYMMQITISFKILDG